MDDAELIESPKPLALRLLRNARALAARACDALEGDEVPPAEAPPRRGLVGREPADELLESSLLCIGALEGIVRATAALGPVDPSQVRWDVGTLPPSIPQGSPRLIERATGDIYAVVGHDGCDQIRLARITTGALRYVRALTIFELFQT